LGSLSEPRHVVTVSEATWIDRPPEGVWDSTQDYTRRTEWDAGVGEATILGAEPRTGESGSRTDGWDDGTRPAPIDTASGS
jgi:hypothetical protein